ncbi:MAG: hypothetical protein ABI778_01455 [Ignavibacteriota bacterium]
MELEEIRDIIRFVKTYYSKDLAPLDLKNLASDESRVASFFQILNDTKVEKDEEAAATLYGSSRLDSKYMFLKSNFTSRVLNSVASLDLVRREISDYTRAVNKAYKQLFISSTLLRLGSRRGAISLAKRTLRLAQKYELHHVAVELLEKLRTNALQAGKTGNYDKYLRKLETEMDLLNSESRVKTLEERVLIHSARSIYIDETLQEQANSSLLEMAAILKGHESFMIRMAHFRMQYMYYQLTGNPQRSIQACDEAIAYMAEMPHMVLPTSFGEFELYKLENCILTHDYNNGKETAIRCSAYFTSGTNNWFLYKGFEYILLMHTLRFEEARDVFEEVTTNSRYASQPSHLRERWDIFRFYLDYVLDLNGESSGDQTLRKSKLLLHRKYRKKVTEFPTFSGDKRGLNVSILVMNILLLLESNRKDRLFEQVEALTTYRTSHLKGKNSHQSAILLRLIQMMVRCDFDLKRMRKNASALERKLGSTMPSPTEIFECVQVLPPDWIWARMKAALIHYS